MDDDFDKNAKHCRERAASLRSLATAASDFEVKNDLFVLALRFDRLAEHAEHERDREAGD